MEPGSFWALVCDAIRGRSGLRERVCRREVMTGDERSSWGEGHGFRVGPDKALGVGSVVADAARHLNQAETANASRSAVRSRGRSQLAALLSPCRKRGIPVGVLDARAAACLAQVD
ncbi:hypothetical protein GCM10009646_13700 [Streptomyces aureus]